jgi:hypothetical protein
MGDWGDQTPLSCGSQEEAEAAQKASHCHLVIKAILSVAMWQEVQAPLQNKTKTPVSHPHQVQSTSSINIGSLSWKTSQHPPPVQGTQAKQNHRSKTSSTISVS